MLSHIPSTYPAHSILTFLHHEHTHVPPCTSTNTLIPQEQEEAFLQRSPLPPIFPALAALEDYWMLREVLATFPPHIHYAIKTCLLLFDPWQQRRLRTLNALFQKEPISIIEEEAAGVSLSVLFLHESVFLFLQGMLLLDYTQYRHELAVLLTQISLSGLPQHLCSRFTSTFSLPLTLLPTYGSWFLCSFAEDRLRTSMDVHAVLLVNEVLLLKFTGKMSAIALHNAVLADGTVLVEGCWYSPIDYRNEIQAAFDRGESRIHFDDGQWTFIRSCYECYLLDQARAYVATLPEQLPQEIAGRTRQRYRLAEHEVH